MKGENKDLREQIGKQNERIADLEQKYKDHEERIEKRRWTELFL